MRNDINGIDAAYHLVFASALQARAPAVAQSVETKIGTVRHQLAGESIAALDSEHLRSESESLVIALQEAASVLGLERPSTSDLAQQ